MTVNALIFLTTGAFNIVANDLFCPVGTIVYSFKFQSCYLVLKFHTFLRHNLLYTYVKFELKKLNFEFNLLLFKNDKIISKLLLETILNLNFNGENFMKIGPEMTLVEFWEKKESFVYNI
jgi:hypothetical protein